MQSTPSDPSRHSTQARVYGAPQEPSVIVRQRFDMEFNDFMIDPHAWARFSDNDTACLRRLNQATSGLVFSTVLPGLWEYDLRRQAQQILPFLYLGPMGAARDVSFLAREGITMLVAVRDSRSARAHLLDATEAAFKLGIPWVGVDVSDNQHFIQALPHTIRLINNHLTAVANRQMRPHHVHDGSLVAGESSTTGKLLIYCESGNDRSAGVVTAYLMAMYARDVGQAIQILGMRRGSIALSDPLKRMLAAFDDILLAQRQTHLSGGADDSAGLGSTRTTAHHPPGPKRKRSEVDDGDTAMTEMMFPEDGKPTDQRQGNAPFGDASP
ncbi:MAG: hypothetical protein M1817_003253 [Caeruleum heppii]|nr:MAG: hypothetical protein M1817_003253 [Caeruleum heppii]